MTDKKGPWVTPRSWQMLSDMLRPTVTLDPSEYSRVVKPPALPQTFDGETGTYSDPKCALCPRESR